MPDSVMKSSHAVVCWADRYIDVGNTDGWWRNNNRNRDFFVECSKVITENIYYLAVASRQQWPR